MSLYALDAVDDALDATRRFLLPFDRVRWARLAVVMFFVTSGGLSLQLPFPPGGGGMGAGPPAGPDVPGGEPVEPVPSFTPEVTPELVALLVGLLALAAVLALGYVLVAAIMEFVFVASLRAESVRLGEFVREHARRGLRLFVFRIVVLLGTVGFVGGAALALGAAAGGWPPTRWGPGTVLAVTGTAVVLGLLAALVVGNLLGFTTVFVVPIMLAEERGVLSAWRRFWPTLTREPLQFLVYAVAGFVLNVVVGIATGIVVLVGAVLLAIPLLVVAVPTFLLTGPGGAGGVVLLVLGVLYVLLVIVFALAVQVPFQTFLRYYALFVLGDANAEFDVIPDARAAVRADGGRARDGRDGGTGNEDGTPDGGGSGDDGDGSPGAGDDRSGGDGGAGGADAATDDR